MCIFFETKRNCSNRIWAIKNPRRPNILIINQLSILGTNIRNADFAALNIKTRDHSFIGKHEGTQSFIRHNIQDEDTIRGHTLDKLPISTRNDDISTATVSNVSTRQILNNTPNSDHLLDWFPKDYAYNK